MSKDIVNRVEKSKLISIDLEDYYMPGERHQIDLKDWLVDELYLKLFGEENYQEIGATQESFKKYAENFKPTFQ